MIDISPYIIAFIKFCIEIYTNICIFLNQYKHIFIKPDDKKVKYEKSINFIKKFHHNSYEDIHSFADIYLKDDEHLKCEWMFNNSTYITYFTKKNINHFLPYTLFNLYCAEPRNKFIACLLTDNITNEIENCTTLIKQLAGPYQNFYNDIPIEIHSQHIWGITNKTLTIITLKDKHTFNLEKDNILTI